jgi:hypothetical protein
VSPRSSLSCLSITTTEEDVSRIRSMSHLSILGNGGGCLQDPLSVTLLCPLLCRRMSPGSSLYHTSLSSIMEEYVSRILSLSCLSILRYVGRCLQDPHSVMFLHPPLWRRMSKGSSLCHASPSSSTEEDFSRILSLSRLFILGNGKGCLPDPVSVTPLHHQQWSRMTPRSLL